MRLVALPALLLLSSISAFAAKPSKTKIEADVRSAMAASGFRRQPINLEADLKPVGAKPAVTGEYRLIWNSSQDWLERIDIGQDTDLTIGKGEREYHKSNTASPVFWTLLARQAFDPQQFWRDGSEWKLDSARTEKIDGKQVECAEFKRPSGALTGGCVDPDSKDLISVNDLRYSQFELQDGVRYPRHIEVVDQQAGPAMLLIDVKKISDGAAIPDVPPGMDSRPNCSAEELTGGEIRKTVRPEYPLAARSRGNTGTVRLMVNIRQDGSTDVKSVAESANSILDEAAIAAVKNWKYSPYLCRGTPIVVSTVITVNFSLR